MALALAGPARADFVNGNFETGDFSGWTLEYAIIKDCVLTGFSPTPSSHPQPAIVTAGSPPFPLQEIAVEPYQGRSMARINDIDGGFHVTRLSQSVTLTSDDLAKGWLALTWGAMLVDPSHEPECQPFVAVEVRAGNVLVDSFEANASNASAPGSGWVEAGVFGLLWYKRDDFCVDLSSQPVGTTVEVAIVVADCGQGSHGGFAFLDDVRFRSSCCLAVPAGLVGWWPLDEAPSASFARDLAFGQDGIFDGPLVGIEGWVDGALDFDGLETQVRVRHPTDLSLDFGSSHATPASGDFSIDAWIRSTDLTGIRPIASKTGCPVPPVPTDLLGSRCPPAGYSFFVQDEQLGLALRDGGIEPYIFLSTPVPGLDDGQWHLVAVTVDRDSRAGVRFYVDATHVTALESDPTACSGSLANTGDFLIGRESLLHPGTFLGQVDEVEIFSRSLDHPEIAALFLAGSRGKCKTEWARLPGKSWFCAGATKIPSMLEVVNESDEDSTYLITAHAMPAGGIYDTFGPGITNSTPVQNIAAHNKAFTPLVLHKPLGLSGAGQQAGYKVRVTNQDTGRVFGDTANVAYSPTPCWFISWTLSDTWFQSLPTATPVPAGGLLPGPGSLAGPAAYVSAGWVASSTVQPAIGSPPHNEFRQLMPSVRTEGGVVQLVLEELDPFAPVVVLLQTADGTKSSRGVLTQASAANGSGEAIIPIDVEALTAAGHAFFVQVHSLCDGSPTAGGLTLILTQA